MSRGWIDRLTSLLTDRLLWILFGAAGALVTLYAIATGRELTYYDEQDYLLIADNVADGQGYTVEGGDDLARPWVGTDGPTAFRPPTWPLLLAAFRLVGAPVWMLSALPALFLIAAAVLAKLLAAHIAGRAAGWLAAFGVLLYPINVYTAGTLYPQTLATALMLGAIVLCLTPAATTRARAALFGLALIALVYSAPTMLFTAAVIAVWGAWRHRGSLVRFVVPALIAALLPAALWIGRNAVEIDRFVPVSTSTGQNLLLGNSPNTTAKSGVSADIEGYVDVALERQLGEVEADSFYTSEAVDWVAENPGDALGLYASKVANYFTPYNAPLTAGEGGRMEKLVSWAAFAPLAALALLRLAVVRRWRLRPGEGLAYVLFLGNAAFMAVTFTRVRFRQPLDSLLVVEAAVVLALLGAAWAARRRQAAAQKLSNSANVSVASVP